MLDSQLRDGPLRGREAELAVIDRLVSALGAGDGGVLLLDGAAGIGKSRLAAEVLGRAQRSGLRILQVEAARGRFAPFPLLLDTALGLDSPVRSRPGTAFRSAAAADPLVIVIDDLHRADAETAMALRTLVAELRHVGVLWVLAARRA
ncbi:MAG TPA: ATP-binding protein, partial [Actinoplanes sp.]|nr:ATP-binding protein [Actinoplanes sp.]